MTANLSPFWVGEISTDMTWSRTVTVGGDVTVMPSATLTIEAGTKIRFLANRDDDGDGHLDNTRSELIVKGRLIASRGDITFGSANPIDPSRTDWYGIQVENGGFANLSTATIRDGARCAQAAAGGTLTTTNTIFLNCGLAPPSPPMNLGVVLGDGRVTLNWEAADANGWPIVAYYVRYRIRSGSESDWEETSLSASALSHTVENLRNEEYLFEVWAENGRGVGTAARKTATPQVAIVGDVEVVFAEIPEGREDWDDFVARYEKSGSFTWSWTGDDKDLFELREAEDEAEARTLHFREPPDFENPQDTLGEDHTYNTYNVTVQVHDAAGRIGSEDDTGYTKAVLVKVLNVNEAGTVEIKSPSEPPRVDEKLMAELTDPDGDIDDESWTWWRQEETSGAVYGYPYQQKIKDAITEKYQPVADDIGYMLQARVAYTDGHVDEADPDKKKRSNSEWTSVVVGDPVLVIDGLAKPTFVENDTEAVAEYTIPNAGDGVAYAWSLSGADAALFRLEPQGSKQALAFRQPPDFEARFEAHGDSIYDVVVEAVPGSGGAVAASAASASTHADMMAAFQRLSSSSSAASSLALTKAVVVAVSNVDEDGLVSLPAGSPRVGEALTVRLKDEDGVLPGTAAWTWSGSTAGPGTDLDGALANSYTPTALDIGQVLQVQVAYEDGFGPQTVVSDPTAAVASAGVVTLTPSEPRVGQSVTAYLEGPEEAVTGAAWSWWRREQDTDEWELLGSSAVAADASAFAGMFGALNWGSTERSSYTPKVADKDWQLQATVAWDGQEAASDPSARVRAGVPCAPRSLAGKGANGANGDGAVVLSWQTPCNNGSAITGYEYQYRLFGSTGWDPDWTDLNGSGATTTSYTVDRLDLGARYTLEVRALNDEGAGPPARTAAKAERFNSAPVITCDPPFPVPILENTGGVVSSCRAEDAEGDKVRWQLIGPDAARFWFPNRRLTLKQSHDFEDPSDAGRDNDYQLHLIASDETLSDTLAVTVWVLNEDEPPRLFGQSQREIFENRTGFVASYYADDPEKESITWSLSGPDHRLFALTPQGQIRQALAVLTLEQPLNFEHKLDANRDGTYELYVEASDTGHKTRIVVYVRVDHQVGRDVSVEVLDVNEPPSIRGASLLFFAENATGDLETYDAFDPERGTITWSLDGEDAPFRIDAIDPSSGRLRVRAAMDYETAPQDDQGERAYPFQVIASDNHPNGSRSSEIGVTVMVIDVNEPPVLSGPDGVEMDENTRRVASYTATDPEGTNITWSVVGGDAGALSFSGSGSPRSLYFYQAPDYELDPRSYAVTIKAEDATGLSATLAVSVSVRDVDESPPPPMDLPGEDPGSVFLNPLQPREGEAVTATLSDPDGGITGTQWTWQSGGTTVSTTDRYEPMAGDVGQVLQVQVSYQDGEGSNTDQASATSAAVLGATEQASCVVQAVDGSSTVSYTEGGTESVASYTARVSDSCGALSWSLSGSDAGSFHLRGSTLYFNTEPAVGSYAVTITATDASGAAAALAVSVTVVADDPLTPTPCNPDQSGSISLSPDPPRVGELVTATLTDPDGGLENVIGGITGPSANQATNSMAANNTMAYVTTILVLNSWLGQTVYAFAQYSDSCGHGKSASTTSQPVVAAAKPVVSRAPPPVSKLTAQAAPNPFNPHTSLHLALPGRGRVELTVYNMAGQVVRTLVDGSLEAGYHTVHWDGRDETGHPVTSGVYLYRVRTDPQVVVGKMALIR